MTIDDRTQIQQGLYQRMTFKAIAKLIEKDPTTVSKEVKLHGQVHTSSFVKTNETCPKLLKAPFVCNGCKLKTSSAFRFTRRVYTAKFAQEEYEKTLVESSEGIALNKAEFYENDRFISERLRAGQHINHILNSTNVSVSKSSVYRFFHNGYMSAGLIELPRVVKFKPRDKKKPEYVPKGVKIGRSYEDSLCFMEQNNLSERIEFDTVIGLVGGKTIMTIHFTAFDFMFGLLLENKTAAEASSKIIDLKKLLFENGFAFGDIFPVILTDNGGEFSDVNSFECDASEKKETMMFFCDPIHPSQKPFVEKNHTLFRDIVPKGSSFENYTQETVNLIFSHVNSVKRNIFNGKSAYEMLAFSYSEKLASLFGINLIAAESVIQSPKLQKTKEFTDTIIAP